MKKNKVHIELACFIILILFSSYSYAQNIVPTEREMLWNKHSVFADSIINKWASKKLPDWNLKNKVDAPRVFLAKLLMSRDIKETNESIMHDFPRGVVGSSWAFNKHGDYDFTLTVLTTILWIYGDQPEYLYPDTKEHLLNVLLNQQGNKFRYHAPRTLGLFPETENHILMTEGSRYLKNRWIQQHGNKEAYFDNVKNGMEQKILDNLNNLKTRGLYEFNSLPYTGYTITALLNLEAFASDAVKLEARNVLDLINWCYALGSYQFKHYPPMRRRYEKAYFQDLQEDYHSIFMKSWISYSSNILVDNKADYSSPHALMGVCMPYRLADETVKKVFEKGAGYFVKMGHGANSCPEIYAAGNHFLISAGGANRGKGSIILPRPICLFLNDTASKLSSVLHLSGPGADYMQWNNTGVYKNFAVAAGPVSIPGTWIPTAIKDNWSFYTLKDNISVAVYSTANLGLFVVSEGNINTNMLESIVNSNSDVDKLVSEFHFPNGDTINYEVKAPSNKWVINSINGTVTDRAYEKWPLIQGDYYK